MEQMRILPFDDHTLLVVVSRAAWGTDNRRLLVVQAEQARPKCQR